MAEVNPGGSPTIMLDGHIDEIGVIVQYIDDDGYLYISPIGGWDPQVLVGQRIRFLGTDGDVLGVVGKKPIHLMKTEDREHASKFTDLWVDIGATKTRRGRGARVERRRSGRARLAHARLPQRSHRLALDRRPDRRVHRARGAAPLRREARRGARGRGGDDAGGDRLAWRRRARSARTASTRRSRSWWTSPSRPIIRTSRRRRSASTRWAVARSSAAARSSRRWCYSLLRETAKKHEIAHAVHAVGRDTSTNADAIHIAREGVATGLVSIPNRYMHSPNEMVSLVDVDNAATLIAEFCRAITARRTSRHAELSRCGALVVAPRSFISSVVSRVGRGWVFRRRRRAYTLRASANCAESLATPDGGRLHTHPLPSPTASVCTTLAHRVARPRNAAPATPFGSPPLPMRRRTRISVTAFRVAREV